MNALENFLQLHLEMREKYGDTPNPWLDSQIAQIEDVIYMRHAVTPVSYELVFGDDIPEKQSIVNYNTNQINMPTSMAYETIFSICGVNDDSVNKCMDFARNKVYKNINAA